MGSDSGGSKPLAAAPGNKKELRSDIKYSCAVGIVKCSVRDPEIESLIVIRLPHVHVPCHCMVVTPPLHQFQTYADNSETLSLFLKRSVC